ncbi:hypothetical protein OROGR_013482 [Orobanche gracilis]
MIVVIHEESCASRHLKHCALELNIPMTVSFTGLSGAYILGSLFPWRRKMIPDLVQSGTDMLCTKESAICGQGRLFCMCLSAKD